jgi:hypothetical protein
MINANLNSLKTPNIKDKIQYAFEEALRSISKESKISP